MNEGDSARSGIYLPCLSPSDTDAGGGHGTAVGPGNAPGKNPSGPAAKAWERMGEFAPTRMRSGGS